jgi:hypothetical protein
LKGWLLPNDSPHYKCWLFKAAIFKNGLSSTRLRTLVARLLLVFGALLEKARKRTKLKRFIEKRDTWKH